MKTEHCTQHTISTLENICMLAAEEYRKSAATFRALINHKPKPDDFMQICGDNAKRMAEQFDGQAEEASRLCQMFQAAEIVVINYDEEQVEDENPFHPESPEGRAWENGQ